MNVEKCRIKILRSSEGERLTEVSQSLTIVKNLLFVSNLK